MSITYVARPDGFSPVQSRRWLYTLIGKKERRWHRSILYIEGDPPCFTVLVRRENGKTRWTTLYTTVTRLSRLPNRCIYRWWRQFNYRNEPYHHYSGDTAHPLLEAIAEVCSCFFFGHDYSEFGI